MKHSGPFGFGLGFSPGAGRRVATGGDVPPTITTSSTFEVDENDTLAISLTSDQSVTWSITGGADQAEFEINSTTLRWASNGTKDFDDPDDADADNAYVVQVRATNGVTGLFATKTITVTVADLVEIGAPVLTLTDDTVNPPLWDVDFADTDAQAGDTLRLEWAYNDTYTDSEIEDEVLDTELLTGNLEGAFPVWEAGLDPAETVWWRVKILRNPGDPDEVDSGWSNELEVEVEAPLTPAEWHTSNGVNKSQHISISGTPPLVATGQNSFNGAPMSVRATQARVGKRQWQYTLGSTGSGGALHIGVDDGTTNLNSGFPRPGQTNSAGVSFRMFTTGEWNIYVGGSSVQSGTNALLSGDTLTCAFDTDAGTVSFYRTTSAVTGQIGTTVNSVSLSSWYANCGAETGAVMTAKFGSGQARTLDSGYSTYDG